MAKASKYERVMSFADQLARAISVGDELIHLQVRNVIKYTIATLLLTSKSDLEAVKEFKRILLGRSHEKPKAANNSKKKPTNDSPDLAILQEAFDAIYWIACLLDSKPDLPLTILAPMTLAVQSTNESIAFATKSIELWLDRPYKGSNQNIFLFWKELNNVRS